LVDVGDVLRRQADEGTDYNNGNGDGNGNGVLAGSKFGTPSG